MAAKQFTLSDIPEELVIHILTFLPVKDVLKVGCTCKNLYKVTNQNIVWKCRFKTENDHLRLLPRNSSDTDGDGDNDFINPRNINSEDGLWKKLFFKSSHALSFGKRDGSVARKKLCAEFVSTTETLRRSRAMGYGLIARLQSPWALNCGCEWTPLNEMVWSLVVRANLSG